MSRILPESTVLLIVRQGRYRVCPVTAKIVGPRGNEVTPFYSGRNGSRAFVRIYFGGKVKTLARSRVVWMSQTGVMIPKGWEVHHRDEDCKNDAWENLIALHKLDHKKCHNGITEVPF